MEKENYSTLEKNGAVYVLRARDRTFTAYPDADFIQTGLALTGVLKIGQSLNAWIEERNNIKQPTKKDVFKLKYSRRARLTRAANENTAFLL